MWQAQIHALVLQKANVYFYSKNLSDGQIEGAMLKTCHSIEAAVDTLIQEYGRDESIGFYLKGHNQFIILTIPGINRKQSILPLRKDNAVYKANGRIRTDDHWFIKPELYH